MKNIKSEGYGSSRDGVALIMVLGLLSILTLLAIAFAISMRVERIAARNYANGVRAKHLVESALARAMEHVEETMAGAVYPCWDEQEPFAVYDALPSYDPASPDKCTDLITGEAVENVPLSLRQEVYGATNFVHWKEVFGSVGGLKGRIAYMVINCSGLIDANYAGGGEYAASSITNLNQIDLDLIRSVGGDSDIQDATAFLANRDDHVRYETLTELVALNNQDPANPVVNDDIYSMGTYSFDPGNDVWFKNRDLVGRRSEAEINLTIKFNINSWTNWQPGGDISVNANLYYPLTPEFYFKYPYPFTHLKTNSMAQAWEDHWHDDMVDAMGRSGLAWISRPDEGTAITKFYQFLPYLQDFLDPDRGVARYGNSGNGVMWEIGLDSNPDWEEFWLESVGGAYPQYRVGVDVWYNKVPKTCAPGEFKVVVTATDYNRSAYWWFNKRSEYYNANRSYYKNIIPDLMDHTRVAPRTKDACWRWDVDIPEMRWPDKQLVTVYTAPANCTLDRVPDSLPVVANGGTDGRIVPAGQDAYFAGFSYDLAIGPYEIAGNTFRDNALTYVNPAPLGSDPGDGRGYITFPYAVKGTNGNLILDHISIGSYPELGDHFSVTATNSITNSIAYKRLTTAPNVLAGIKWYGPAAEKGKAFDEEFFVYDLMQTTFPVRGTNYWEAYGISTNNSVANRMLWGVAWAHPLVCWTTNYNGKDYTMLCGHPEPRLDIDNINTFYFENGDWFDGFQEWVSGLTPDIVSPDVMKDTIKNTPENHRNLSAYAGIKLSFGGVKKSSYHFLEAEKSVQWMDGWRTATISKAGTETLGSHTPNKGKLFEDFIDYYNNEARGGLPLYIADRPPESVSEFAMVLLGALSGHAYDFMNENNIPGRRCGTGAPVNMFNRLDGAGLMDQMRVYSGDTPLKKEGVFAISSGQKDVLYSLLRNLRINRNTNFSGMPCYWEPDDDALKILASELIDTGPFISWYDMWGWDVNRQVGHGPTGSETPYSWANGNAEGPHSNRVANAIRNVLRASSGETSIALDGSSYGGIRLGDIYPLPSAVSGGPPSDKRIWNVSPRRTLEIDLLSQLAEIISFRNNYLTIIVAAQAMGADDKTVVGEKRAIASVYRDSYTGKHFIRSFKWLND